jgi:hypothetical protein
MKGDCGLDLLQSIADGIRVLVEILKLAVEFKKLNRKD